MFINDPIYGECEIKDQILVDLAASKSIQRLKGVAQYGWHDKNYPYAGFSRYEHSVGVMLLLKRLGADLKTQVAGLLHDISHTAFSHCVDFVFDHAKNEDFHDKAIKDFFQKTDANIIVEEYGYNPEEIINMENFSIIRNEIPNASADNIDYALREFEIWANPGVAQDILNNLVIIDDEIIFKKFNLARIFADTFLRLQTEHWGSFDASSRFYRMAKILKTAIADKIITEDDLFVDDQHVIQKIYESQRNDLIGILESAQEKEIKQKLGNQVIKKFRYVVPKVLIDNEVKDLTTIDLSFVENLNFHRENNLNGVEV